MNKYLTLIKILMLIGVTSIIAEEVKKCQPIKLLNGRVRVQRRGRQIRFRCLKGYEFVGRRYMSCFRGQWDFERDPSVNQPMCVKPGCRASSYVNGHFLETYNGAVVSVVCNLGYTVIGPSTVYCNGQDWNQPFPECKAINPAPPKSCDFEEDLCGWTQDPFGDWLWHKTEESGRSCPHKEDCKEPPYYHANLGRYMLLGNSSSRIANQTERLYSPVFPAEYSNNSCFAFWYLMHGRTAGYLKVFLKPEGVELYNTIPPFWVSGHQSESWLPGYFPLYPSEVPFQMVIEGMSLPGNESVTAFDDVKIQSGEECDRLRKVFLAFMPPSTTSAETTIDDGTCENRCGSTVSNSDKCDCGETCLKEGTCCVDYGIFCGKEETTTTEMTTTPIETTTTSSPEMTPKTRNATEEWNEIPKHGNDHARNGSDPVDNKFTTAANGVRSESTSTTTPVTRTKKTTATTPRRRTGLVKYQIHVDPSHSAHVKTRLDGRTPLGRLHGTGEDSPLSIKSAGDHSTPTSSGVPSGTVEAVIAVAVLLVCVILIAAFIRRRRRKKTEKESLVEDSDSICFGMNPIYEKFSSQSSLICIRPNRLVDGEASGAGNRCEGG